MYVFMCTRTHTWTHTHLFSLSVSQLFQNETIYLFNVTVNPDNLKVLHSSAVFVSIPPQKGKTNVVKINPVKHSVKLKVLVATNQSQLTVEAINHYGIDWPIDDKSLVMYKGRKQDPVLLFLSEEDLGEDQKFHVGVLVKVICCCCIFKLKALR